MSSFRSSFLNGYVRQERREDGIKGFQAMLRQDMGHSNFYSSLNRCFLHFILDSCLFELEDRAHSRSGTKERLE